MHFLKFTNIKYLFVLITFLISSVFCQVGLKKQQITLTPDVKGPCDLKTADLDNDGDQDIISVSIHDNQIAWYKNINSKTFSPQKIVSTSAISVSSSAVADLNNDGNVDIIANSNNKLIWFKNNSNSFSGKKIIKNATFGAGSIIAADLNKDGNKDIISSSLKDKNIYWCQNDGKGNFAKPVTLAEVNSAPTYIEVSDLNNDSEPDLVYSSKNSGHMFFIKNLGEGNFSSPSNLISNKSEGTDKFAVNDINNDGKKDILTINKSKNKIFIYFNNGDSSWKKQNFNAEEGQVKSVSLTDIDADGDQDILVSYYKNKAGKLFWYENKMEGSTFKKHKNLCLSEYPINTIHTANLSGDNKPEIVSAIHKDNKIIWFKNKSNGFAKYTLLTDSDTKPGAIQHCDMNNDNHPDILYSSPQSDQIAWYKNKGDGSFKRAQIITNNASGAESIYASDLDGDQDIDVISAARNDNRIVWHKNTGETTYDRKIIISNSASGIKSIYCSDLNGDGKNDLLCVYNNNKMTWFKNKGKTSFSSQQRISGPEQKSDMIYAINDFENIDIYYSSVNDKIAWYESLSSYQNNDKLTTQLYQNYPNPFNPITAIKCCAQKQSDITISIYNMMGKKLSQITKNKAESGFHTFFIDASDLKKGNYIYKMQTDDYKEMKKMLLKR